MEKLYPNKKPMEPPRKLIIAASRINNLKTSARFAPRAFKIPISFVLCSNETLQVFNIPIADIDIIIVPKTIRTILTTRKKLLMSFTISTILSVSKPIFSISALT